MKTNYRSALLLAGLFSCALMATAQQESIARKAQVSQEKIPSIINFSENSNARFAQASNNPESILGLPDGNKFVSVKQLTDNLGHTHNRYIQTFKGIEVAGGSASMNYSDSGQLLSLSNEAYIINDLNTTPTISAERAEQFAYNFFGADEYIQDKPLMAKAIGFNKEAPKLMILPILDGINPGELVTEFELVYAIEIFATQPEIKHNIVYVNANLGTIAWNQELLFHTGKYAHSSKKENTKNANVSIFAKKAAEAAFAEGIGATRYSGNRNIETTSTSSGFVLRDATRGGGINTFNSGNTNRYPNTDFRDNDNNWTAAEYDNQAKDNGALDAHWGAEITYDYWLETHNRNSYDGRGATINSWVHFNQSSGSSTGYDNAFWNGRNMTYGDGNNFDILTSIDVVAHEIGHAVCTNTANLAYRNESGALNEGFSDIWGAAVEFYGLQAGSNSAPSDRIWDIGEDLGRNLRSMSDPKSRRDPDTYLGTNWKPATPAQGCASPGRTNDQCGVHSNSGVLNHWFYILVVGKSGTNDAGDTYNVSGIGMDKAAKIAYRMESVYLTVNSNFADAREAGIQSAKDLYGASGAEEIATTNAFYAVNVGGAYSGGGNPDPDPDPNPADTEAPSTPGNLTGTSPTNTTIELEWEASTDNVGVVGYEVYLGADRLITTTTDTFANLTGATAGTTYSFKIRAIDAAGNGSEFSNIVTITAGSTPDVDTQAPTAPSNLVASDIQDTSVQLTWDAATDNVGVTGYQVWSGNNNLGTVTTLTEPVTGLVKGNSYTFRIKAVDAAGNVSDFSNSVEVTAGASNDICAGVAAYNRNIRYSIGDRVTFRGFLYERESTRWVNLGACGNSINGFIGQKENAIAPPFNVATSISFFPNPVNNGILNIAIDGSEEHAFYTINNLLGQVVQQGVIEGNRSTLNLDELITGIYMVEVRVGTEKFLNRIAIK